MFEKKVKDKKFTYYAAYGSNLNIRQMQFRCPTAEVLGTSVLENYGLRFRGVATVEPSVGESVPLLVWKVTQGDRIALDRYEGWPELYRREGIKVLVDGKPHFATIYIMNEHNRGYGTPSRGYYETIREGYEDAGFDTGVLDNAVKVSEQLSKGREG